MTSTIGLSDNQRTLIGIAFTAILTINGSLAAYAAANNVVIPAYVYLGLGITAMVIYAIKDNLGIRDSSTAAVAKTVDASYQQLRKV